MNPKALLSFILTIAVVALNVTARSVPVKRSPVTVPLTRRYNGNTARKLIERDRVRAQTFQTNRCSKNSIPCGSNGTNVAVHNQLSSYIASVGVGEPATTYQLIIDTGSSNTWVGAAQPYVRTKTGIQTNDNFTVSYGSAKVSGTESLDTVTLGANLVIRNQSIGVALESTGLDGVDGILGLGPADLTKGTLFPANTLITPTVTDNLFSQGTISENLFGISYNPTNRVNGSLNGEITWGSVDSTKFTGEINYIPLSTTRGISEFWGFNQTVQYGSSQPILAESAAGILDTGTTLILFTTEAYNRYVNATGAVLDDSTGCLRVTRAQYEKLQSLFFRVGDVTYELTPNAQLWPRTLNTHIGGTADAIYLIIGDLGPSTDGLEFISGYTFLERFYSVYDTTNKRVGLATTPLTYSLFN